MNVSIRRRKFAAMLTAAAILAAGIPAITAPASANSGLAVPVISKVSSGSTFYSGSKIDTRLVFRATTGSTATGTFRATTSLAWPMKVWSVPRGCTWRSDGRNMDCTVTGTVDSRGTRLPLDFIVFVPANAYAQGARTGNYTVTTSNGLGGYTVKLDFEDDARRAQQDEFASRGMLVETVTHAGGQTTLSLFAKGNNVTALTEAAGSWVYQNCNSGVIGGGSEPWEQVKWVLLQGYGGSLVLGSRQLARVAKQFPEVFKSPVKDISDGFKRLSTIGPFVGFTIGGWIKGEELKGCSTAVDATRAVASVMPRAVASGGFWTGFVYDSYMINTATEATLFQEATQAADRNKSCVFRLVTVIDGQRNVSWAEWDGSRNLNGYRVNCA